MSAIRTKRRSGPRAPASPYARPAPKKSAWSITGLLSYLNPLRLRSDSEDDADASMGERDPNASTASEDDAASVAEVLATRGRQLAQEVPPPEVPAAPTFIMQTPPPSTSATLVAPMTAARDIFSPLPEHPSPAKNIETVANFLSAKKGQNLSEIEVEGVIALLSKSTSPEKPFRFESSTSSPPPRGSTPFSSGNSLAADAQTPRKTLTKNPNGPYRWEGGGSARPRNRYRSPAFGSSRSAPAQLKIPTPPAAPQTDTKRRRVGESAEASNAQRTPRTPEPQPQPQPRSAAPSPAQLPDASSLPFPVSSGAPRTNGTPAAPRLRTAALPKPTQPAVPSPLRQAWGDGEGSPPSAPARQSKAASFMQELIKEVTPPRRPDVSNPYQTASPVKPTLRKPSAKRPRATGRPSVPPAAPAQPEPEISPQAIIEATLPKGSKRSRPPATIEKPSGNHNLSVPTSIASSRRSPRQAQAVLPATNGDDLSLSAPNDNDTDADADSHVSKRSKKAFVNGHGPPPPVRNSHPPTVEEVPDEEMPLAPPAVVRPTEVIEPANETPAPAPMRAPLSLGKTSAPKEPSKLRFSYQPAPPSPAPSQAFFATPTPTPTPPPPPPQPAPQAAAPAPAPSAPFFAPAPVPAPAPVASSSKLTPKDAALRVAAADLPVYRFTIAPSASPATPQLRAARAAALRAPLQSYTFSVRPDAGAAPAPAPAPAPAAPAKAFDWAKAGMKPPAPAAGWTCGTCALANPADAQEKCTVCDAPRPGAKAAAAPVKGFDWAAAGMKPPAPAAGWTCGTCGLASPADADKCTVCDAPR